MKTLYTAALDRAKEECEYKFKKFFKPALDELSKDYDALTAHKLAPYFSSTHEGLDDNEELIPSFSVPKHAIQLMRDLGWEIQPIKEYLESSFPFYLCQRNGITIELYAHKSL